MPSQYSRRLKGPQETQSLTSISCKINTSNKSSRLRQDGRGEDEIRPLYLKAGKRGFSCWLVVFLIRHTSQSFFCLLFFQHLVFVLLKPLLHKIL